MGRPSLFRSWETMRGAAGASWRRVVGKPVWPPRLTLPEGFVGFSKGLLSENPHVLEKMIVVALCDFTQRVTLLGADGPAPHSRDHNRHEADYPYLPMLCPKTGPGVRWPLARNRDEHGTCSKFHIGREHGPPTQSRINRSSTPFPAKHCFSTLPEFYS